MDIKTAADICHAPFIVGRTFDNVTQSQARMALDKLTPDEHRHAKPAFTAYAAGDWRRTMICVDRAQELAWDDWLRFAEG